MTEEAQEAQEAEAAEETAVEKGAGMGQNDEAR